MKDDDKEDKKAAIEKRKRLALKVAVLEKELSNLDVDGNNKDEDTTLVAWKFKRLFEKRIKDLINVALDKKRKKI